ncbi:uncharacterized protein LOC129974965 isoform X2 [Argiope bruennichi]|nr:uncharacterized protein LOC129974965 isoform X2 [Argiope bruennichi]
MIFSESIEYQSDPRSDDEEVSSPKRSKAFSSKQTTVGLEEDSNDIITKEDRGEFIENHRTIVESQRGAGKIQTDTGVYQRDTRKYFGDTEKYHVGNKQCQIGTENFQGDTEKFQRNTEDYQIDAEEYKNGTKEYQIRNEECQSHNEEHQRGIQKHKRRFVVASVAPRKKRRTGGDVNPKQWARNANSAKRRMGEKYVGLKKLEDGKYKLVNERKERQLQPRCNCRNTKRFNCEKIVETERQKLFHHFWKGIDSWEGKKAVIASLVDKSKPDYRRKTTNIENLRKNISFKYYLKRGDEKVRVCKTMFLNTFDLSDRAVRSWVMKSPLNRHKIEERNENDIENFQCWNECSLKNISFSRQEIETRNQSSGTVAKEAEKKDHIPIEPTVEIKEEPTDYASNPSTSSNNINEEFILPHEESSWTASDTVVEPQFTLSVASLSSPNGPETSDGEQLKKKRKPNPNRVSTTTTFVPPVKNGPEMRQQSPVYNFDDFPMPSSLSKEPPGEFSSLGPVSKEPRKDQFDVFGEYIAAKLRSLDRRSCAFAQKAIGDIIFEAEMGKYLTDGRNRSLMTQS